MTCLERPRGTFSIDAVGESRVRSSGGYAIFGQSCLATCQGFQHQSRICGVFTSGFLLTVYFPTKSPKQQMDQYREMFSIFVNDLLYFVHSSISNHAAEWIACGAKLNAHFRGVWFTSLKKG